jgi:type IV secretory pathway VirJ component
MMIALGLALVTALAATPVAGPADVGDLPLVEVRSPREGGRFAVILTGDGGWAGADKALAKVFSDAGVSVVGLSSPEYFSKRRTPEETAAAVARIISHYRVAWGRPETLLVGYSRGADIVPFVAGRLPPSAREGLALVAMIGPATSADFQFYFTDLFRTIHRSTALSTESAVKASGGACRMLCIQGAEERDSVCPRLVDLPWVTRVVLRGGWSRRRRCSATPRAPSSTSRSRTGRWRCEPSRWARRTERRRRS